MPNPEQEISDDVIDFLPEAFRESRARLNLQDAQRQEAMLRHARLLLHLRQLGIAQMIEEEAGTKIPPLVTHDANGRPSSVDVMKYAFSSHRGDIHNSVWRLHSFPQATPQSFFDDTLRIRADKYHNFREVEPYVEDHEISSVLIEFRPDRILRVVGAEELFNSSLGRYDQTMAKRVKGAIKQAFAQPETKPVPGQLLRF